MTEKKKGEFHCACGPGDLSAVEPVVASSPDETTAKADESKPPKPAAPVTPGAVERPKTRG